MIWHMIIMTYDMTYDMTYERTYDMTYDNYDIWYCTIIMIFDTQLMYMGLKWHVFVQARRHAARDPEGPEGGFWGDGFIAF